MWRGMLWTGVIVLILPALALAGTVTGVSGLLHVPSATTMSPQLMEASVRFLNGEAMTTLTMGIVDEIEVGIYTSTSREPMGMTVKGIVVSEQDGMPAIAVGIDGTATYLVMSRQLGDVQGYIGIGGRHNGVFGGLETVINGDYAAANGVPVVRLLMEFDGRAPNVGARLEFGPRVRLDAAILDRHNVLLGISLVTSYQ